MLHSINQNYFMKLDKYKRLLPTLKFYLLSSFLILCVALYRLISSLNNVCNKFCTCMAIQSVNNTCYTRLSFSLSVYCIVPFDVGCVLITPLSQVKLIFGAKFCMCLSEVRSLKFNS